MSGSTATADPFRGYLFKISIKEYGDTVAGFSEVTVPDITIDTVDYREGIDAPHRRTLSGLTSYAHVTLKRGLTTEMSLYQWHADAMNYGTSWPGVRKNVIITLNDGSKDVVGASWTLYNAWPVIYQTGGLNAGSAEVVIETLELAIDRLDRGGGTGAPR